MPPRRVTCLPATGHVHRGVGDVGSHPGADGVLSDLTPEMHKSGKKTDWPEATRWFRDELDDEVLIFDRRRSYLFPESH